METAFLYHGGQTVEPGRDDIFSLELFESVGDDGGRLGCFHLEEGNFLSLEALHFGLV